MDTRRAALVFGIVFLAVGILGFVPGVNQMHGADTHGGTLTVTGPGHGNLLGLFHVNVLHNVVHLLFGVTGLVLARTVTGARGFLVGGGVVYLVLWIYGLIVDHDSAANFVPVNGADNWLHLLLGVGMAGLGLALSQTRTRADRPA